MLQVDVTLRQRLLASDLLGDINCHEDQSKQGVVDESLTAHSFKHLYHSRGFKYISDVKCTTSPLPWEQIRPTEPEVVIKRGTFLLGEMLCELDVCHNNIINKSLIISSDMDPVFL